MKMVFLYSFLIFGWCAVSNATNYRSDVAMINNALLIFSTLDGTIYGVDKNSGDTLWSLKDKPPIDNPDATTSFPAYLPDPVDGSLYLSTSHGLKKLPLTIPELVGVSPSRSNEGLLYSATKQDSWIAIDTNTGNKLYTFSSISGVNDMCLMDDVQESFNTLHIPQTVYRVAVLDSNSKEVKWNISFTQYGSPSYSTSSSQDLLHFCSNFDGSMLSVDALTGSRVWSKQFNSPVVGVYMSEGYGNLRKVSMTTVEHNTLKGIAGSISVRKDSQALLNTRLSLFVGSEHNQMYAMKSLAEQSLLKEFPTFLSLPPLIDGPDSTATPTKSISIGHYFLPDDMLVQLEPIFKQVEMKSSESVVMETVILPNNNVANGSNKGGEEGVVSLSASMIVLMMVTVLFSTILASLVAVLVTKATADKQKVVIKDAPLSGTPSPMSSQTGTGSVGNGNLSNRQQTSTPNGSSISSLNRENTNFNGELVIGKISYSVQEVLGKGSHGTIVFKGSFDSREVAVKRIIPECFDLADREVALLRESDQHPNVVRYFCMEEDATFRYISLELCQASVYEYVQGHKLYDIDVDEKRILWESVSGVSHLHSLGIVHRDIKPQNVLLTLDKSGRLKALISDFGLCRKLPHGRGSFTAQSGVLGTEGWIAPEMFQDKTRVTCAVDIFALGCLIYYVLTKGAHPFGPPLKRQSNIESGDYVLTHLLGTDRHAVESLVCSMICNNSKFRPLASEVLGHCMFWSLTKQLAFFQDVSDRIEKELPSSAIVQCLERGGMAVVKGDWKNYITEDLRQDLVRFRSYQSSSVRDLLRAMRNKKHHYRELSEGLRRSLGPIPDGYVSYFISRFPSLLIHTYKQMEAYKHETIFKPYYSPPQHIYN